MTVWEIFSNAKAPYESVANVIMFLESGERLNRPFDCPHEVYQLMLKCWQQIPLDRFDFLKKTQQSLDQP